MANEEQEKKKVEKRDEEKREQVYINEMED